MNEVNYFKQVFGAKGAKGVARAILDYDDVQKAEDVPERDRAKNLGLNPVQYRVFRSLARYAIMLEEEKNGRSEDTGVAK